MFDYILDKISAGPTLKAPFPHVEIDGLFTEEHFNALTAAPDICLDPSQTDDELFEKLFSSGYRIIEFPGCVRDHKEYVKWHKDKTASKKINTACEGFGVVLRLAKAQSDIVHQLMQFLESKAFVSVIADKFGVDPNECNYDCGIQKYLDGYEISPHPDIRRKALTYMVNINPSADAEANDHHTHYMRFTKEFAYIEAYWKGNKSVDTCWVPWGWCEDVKQQRSNNSMVIFAPSEETLHAVKAAYDHLGYQRTQLYGNLWFKEQPCTITGNHWEHLVIDHDRARNLNEAIANRIPWRVKQLFKGKQGQVDDKDKHATRDF